MYSYALHEIIPRVVDEYVGKAVAQQVRFDVRIFSEYNLNNNWVFRQPTPNKQMRSFRELLTPNMCTCQIYCEPTCVAAAPSDCKMRAIASAAVGGSLPACHSSISATAARLLYLPMVHSTDSGQTDSILPTDDQNSVPVLCSCKRRELNALQCLSRMWAWSCLVEAGHDHAVPRQVVHGTHAVMHCIQL